MDDRRTSNTSKHKGQRRSTHGLGFDPLAARTRGGLTQAREQKAVLLDGIGDPHRLQLLDGNRTALSAHDREQNLAFSVRENGGVYSSPQELHFFLVSPPFQFGLLEPVWVVLYASAIHWREQYLRFE